MRWNNVIAKSEWSLFLLWINYHLWLLISKRLIEPSITTFDNIDSKSWAILERLLRPVIKNKFTVWMRQLNPPPLAEWDTLKTGLFGSNLFPCEIWIKIKVVSEEKITKSFFLVNKNQYSMKRDYISETCLEKLKSLP